MSLPSVIDAQTCVKANIVAELEKKQKRLADHKEYIANVIKNMKTYQTNILFSGDYALMQDLEEVSQEMNKIGYLTSVAYGDTPGNREDRDFSIRLIFKLRVL